MPRSLTKAVALGLAATVSAASSSITSSASLPSGSVVSIFLLDSDSQSLFASRIASSNGLETLAIRCAPSADPSVCDYPSPITVTAGSSYVSASANFEGLTAAYGCKLTGTTTGFCSITYIGDAADFATDDAQASTLTGTTTTSTSGSLDMTDITFFPVTITAGPGIKGAAAAASTSGSSSSSGSGSSKSSSSGSGGSSSSPTGSSSSSASGSAGGASGTSSSPVSTKTSGAETLVIPGLAGLAVLILAALL